MWEINISSNAYGTDILPRKCMCSLNLENKLNIAILI